MYADRIDVVRKAIAIAMAVCGVGLVVCIQRDDYLTGTLRYEPGIWRLGMWAFGSGVAACLIATLASVVEYLARPTAPTAFTLRSLFARSMIILVVLAAIGVSMAVFFGFPQGVGAVIGTILLLAALRERSMARAILAVLAAIVLGPTLLSTQSAYQYARRNADAIVADGCELMDQWPKKDFDREIKIDDSRIPKVFHSLGVRQVWIADECVFIYVPRRYGFSDREFVICRTANPTTVGDSVWIKRPSNKDEMVKIDDRLWMTDY
jgi:hypothetical protein